MTPTTTISPKGTLTFACIDGPDDWFWAVVTGYVGPQEYGDVLFAFAGGYEPEPALLGTILAALEN